MFQNKTYPYKCESPNIRFRAITNRLSKRISVLEGKTYEPIGYTYRVGLFGKRVYTNFVIPTATGKEVMVLNTDIDTLFKVERRKRGGYTWWLKRRL